MPMPFLPLEFVSLVLTELRRLCAKDVDVDLSRRDNGLNVALVCKAWKPLGLGIVWHDLTLDSPTATRRAYQHFQAHPHLLHFAQEVCVVNSVTTIFQPIGARRATTRI
ncbi:hypothetical protein JCM10213_001764 [Rhodosporidiobolus nylandii]